MKAFKKIIIIVLTAVMLVSTFSLPAAASAPAGGALSYQAINIKYQIALGVAETANAQIEALVEAAQGQSNPNIPLLVFQTNLISAVAITVIRALGFNAECEYVTYEIGGQLVDIDPIIVFPLGD